MNTKPSLCVFNSCVAILCRKKALLFNPKIENTNLTLECFALQWIKFNLGVFPD